MFDLCSHGMFSKKSLFQTVQPLDCFTDFPTFKKSQVCNCDGSSCVKIKSE